MLRRELVEIHKLSGCKKCIENNSSLCVIYIVIDSQHINQNGIC